MSINIVVEVFDHAPAILTTGDRYLLSVLAEKANDATRECYPGWELIAWRMRWADQKDGGKGAVRVAVANLAKRLIDAGYPDIRVPLGEGKDGRKVYATKGRSATYRIPVFLPPPGCRCPRCSQRGATSAPLTVPQDDPKGGQPVPTFDGEADPKGGESAYVKGGNPHTYRGAIHIRKGGQPVPPLPSGTLKEPSSVRKSTERVEPTDTVQPDTTQARIDEKTEPEPPSKPAPAPKPPAAAPSRPAPPPPGFGTTPPTAPKQRQPSLIPTTALRPPQAVEIILDDLRHRGHPEATRDDAEAIRRAVAAQNGSKIGPNYLRAIAQNSGFDGWYADLRRQRSKQVEAELKRLRATEPACEHGTEAGRTPHPTTGQPLCPECRRGNPQHDDGTPSTHPDDQAAIAAYLAAAPKQPKGIFAATLAGQSRQLRLKGLNRDQLCRLATRAAQANLDLFQALQTAAKGTTA